MALFARVYFHAVFGGLGGLLGWMLFGAFADPRSSDSEQWLLGGAFIGGGIGYFVSSVEAIRDRSLLRFCRMASFGVVLGAAGGAAGMWLGETISYQLIDQLPRLASGPRGAASLRVGGEVLFRGLGWLLLGLAIGLGEGVAALSLDKLRFALIGGGLGGLAGGIGYGVLKLVWTEGASDIWGPALGLVLLGAAIGALSALVQGVLQTASVRVPRAWPARRELQDGDRIQLGNVVLRFQTREARSKQKGRKKKEEA